MNCDHSSIGEDPTAVRFFDCCHTYYRGDKRLTSITGMMKRTWPAPKDFESAPEWRVENARERGVEVDMLFSAYLNGRLHEIPSGTREDSAELFMRLIRWWEKRPQVVARAQVILADDELAGTADIVPPQAVYDLKTTYNLEPTYRVQVGGYCHLYQAQYGELPRECGIVHLTERFPEPKFVPLDVLTVVSEFRVVRDMWRLTQRLSSKRQTAMRLTHNPPSEAR